MRTVFNLKDNYYFNNVVLCHAYILKCYQRWSIYKDGTWGIYAYSLYSDWEPVKRHTKKKKKARKAIMKV